MKMRIFSLALGAGFLFLFSFTAVFVYRFSKADSKPAETETGEESYIYTEPAVFLLAFENGGEYGPFSLVALDVENGRIPVFSFSGNTAMEYSGTVLTASELFYASSEKVFAGAAEKALGIEIDGYFIWNEESAENIISKSGSFDYVLPESLKYSDGKRYIDLSAGVQSMTGKKFFDIVTYPKYSETERCDTLSRMLAEFLRRRLRRFLPENGDLSSVLYRSTKTDVSAIEREQHLAAIRELLSTGRISSSHVTCDVIKDEATGFFRFSDETLLRVKKYFSWE